MPSVQVSPRRHRPYVVDRNINYSNIFIRLCILCVLSQARRSRGYLLSLDEIHEKVDETISLGGSGTDAGRIASGSSSQLVHGHAPSIKERHPDFYLHCFSPTEIHALTSVTRLPADEILRELKSAGLDSIPGGGGEILVDAIRKRRRSSCGADDWLDISAQAHEAGLPTTATMMIGLGETDWMRAEHLQRVRNVQDQTGGFILFIPWTFQPDNTPLGKKITERVPLTNTPDGWLFHGSSSTTSKTFRFRDRGIGRRKTRPAKEPTIWAQ